MGQPDVDETERQVLAWRSESVKPGRVNRLCAKEDDRTVQESVAPVGHGGPRAQKDRAVVGTAMH